MCGDLPVAGRDERVRGNRPAPRALTTPVLTSYVFLGALAGGRPVDLPSEASPCLSWGGLDLGQRILAILPVLMMPMALILRAIAGPCIG